MTLRLRLIGANLVALAVLGGMLLSMLPPPTPATHAAIEHVRQEVEYLMRVAPDLPREYVVALTVNSYVVGHISAPILGYRTAIAGPTAPTWPDEAIVEDALAEGAGLCGAATLTALVLYDALGVDARSISAWYSDPNGREIGHLTTEVYYGGRWHWFDPTWGAFHRDGATVYSLLEVVTMSPTEQAKTLVENDTLAWAEIVAHVGDSPMAFTTYSHLRVELADQVLYRR